MGSQVQQHHGVEQVLTWCRGPWGVGRAQAAQLFWVNHLAFVCKTAPQLVMTRDNSHTAAGCLYAASA